MIIDAIEIRHAYDHSLGANEHVVEDVSGRRLTSGGFHGLEVFVNGLDEVQLLLGENGALHYILIPEIGERDGLKLRKAPVGFHRIGIRYDGKFNGQIGAMHTVFKAPTSLIPLIATDKSGLRRRIIPLIPDPLIPNEGQSPWERIAEAIEHEEGPFDLEFNSKIEIPIYNDLLKVIEESPFRDVLRVMAGIRPGENRYLTQDGLLLVAKLLSLTK